jgi:hypothetical protein
VGPPNGAQPSYVSKTKTKTRTVHSFRFDAKFAITVKYSKYCWGLHHPKIENNPIPKILH